MVKITMIKDKYKDRDKDKDKKYENYQILVVDGVVLDSPTLRLDFRLPLVLIWGIQRFTICHSITHSHNSLVPFWGFQCFTNREER